MPKPVKNHNEIDDIREDLNSLKGNIVELTKHIKKDGQAEINDIQSMAEERIENITNASKQRYQDIRKNVKAKPERALALAFVGGLVASYLMARK